MSSVNCTDTFITIRAEMITEMSGADLIVFKFIKIRHICNLI